MTSQPGPQEFFKKRIFRNRGHGTKHRKSWVEKGDQTNMAFMGKKNNIFVRIPLIEKVYNASLQWASPAPGVLQSQQQGWNKRSGKEVNLWFSALRSITLLCLQVGDFLKPINKLEMLMMPLIFAGQRPSYFQCWGYLASLSKHQSPGEGWMLCARPRATALSRTLLRPWLCTRTCSQCWPSWPWAWRKQRK